MINKIALEFVEKCEDELKEIYKNIDFISLFNQNKVLNAFFSSNVCLTDIASSTGYGNDDRAKIKLAEIYSSAYGAETGIVSPLITSGTHALTIALFGILRPGDLMLSVSGKPYDTLINVIFGEGNGSLKDFKVDYDDVELLNNDFNFDLIEKKIEKRKPKIVYIQRSRGYTTRDSLSIEKIEKLIKFVKKIDPSIFVFVDNCYGEFVETKEPCEVGADVAVGSLIKNAGGGIAPTGGYIVGKKYCIEQISSRFIAPSIAFEVGSYAGSYTPFFQGFFVSPQTVANAIKGNYLIGKVAEKFGIESFPKCDEMPHDIVRTFKFGDKDKLIDFCRLIQKLSPIDSNAVPCPWDMPGYSDQVIMASGSFVQGSSIELSADGPIREPFYCYMQGGLTYNHLKLFAIEFASMYLGE